MIQSYPILGPCAWMGFSVPRNHREELKVLHDCWDKGIKLVLLFFALWHIHIHMISHGLQCTPYMNGIMFLSPSSGLPCLSSNASHFFVTTVTQPSLTQWFDSLTFRNIFFSANIVSILIHFPAEVRMTFCRVPLENLGGFFRNWPLNCPKKFRNPNKKCNRTNLTKEGLNITFGGFLNKKQKR